MQRCAAVRTTCRRQQTSQLWIEGRREGCGLFCSQKLPHLRTMSQQFCHRLLSVVLSWITLITNLKKYKLFFYDVLFEIFISFNRQCIKRLPWELRYWLGNSKTWIFLCWLMILIMDKKQSMLWNDSTVIGTLFSYIKSIITQTN